MQADHNDYQPIIIKKVYKKKEPHHGGAWKIAYADFVTAMMAFFLLMWLLSMLNKFQLMGISNYFNKPNKNVFVDNQKNDSTVKKIPAAQTKKYKLVMTNKEKAPIDARSRGMATVNTVNPKDKENTAGFANKKTQNSQDTASRPKRLSANDVDADLTQFKHNLQNALKNNKELREYKGHLSFEMVEDGLKINMHELEGKPMFSSGKSDFAKYAQAILTWLSAEINQTDRKILIIGHTDSSSYPKGMNYSNWELSVDRANAARRLLAKSGMFKNRVVRIEGAADSSLLDNRFGQNPVNRRIEIIVLTNSALKKLTNKE